MFLLKNIYNYLKLLISNTINKIKNIKFLTKSFIISFLAVFLSINYIPELSSFALLIFLAGMAIWFLFKIDEYFLPNIDLLEELKKGNIAYALALLGVAIIIAAAIIGSK